MSNARNYLWAGAASVLVMLTGTVAWGVLAEIETQPPSIQSLQSTMPVVSPVLAHTLHADIEKSLPVVVKTVPEAGVEDVDPGIQEVRVTFSKKMSDGSWTWAQDLGYGKALTSSGKIFYDKDGKTCVMPVKLQPNTTYAVWLNGGRFMSFVDTDGNKSLPYLLVFRTGSGK